MKVILRKYTPIYTTKTMTCVYYELLNFVLNTPTHSVYLLNNSSVIVII